MRKLLFIALMVLLSLQATWAMASGYCEHSGGSHEQHFGHHEGHHHEVGDEGDEGAEAAEAAADGPSTSNDGEAAHCHGVGVAMLSTEALMPALIGTPPPAFSVHVDWQLPPIAPPERPQWASHV